MREIFSVFKLRSECAVMWLELGVFLTGFTLGFIAGGSKTPGAAIRVVSILAAMVGGVTAWQKGGEATGILLISLNLGFMAGLMVGVVLREREIVAFYERVNSVRAELRAFRDELNELDGELGRISEGYAMLRMELSELESMRGDLRGIRERLSSLARRLERISSLLEE